ncbi:SET domain-containing protein [Calocera cornea HHB12733]|uniref:SET domain-containing protein n=1 Tax=Calocera cornea HHB12733 TaxID=1353952 RepID=A0A165I3H6_9BASI|nr:SET domain-containing protein [Calocera cornea HHB12733]
MAAETNDRVVPGIDQYFRMAKHPTRRSAARALRDIPSGLTIMTETAVTAVLADDQRGKRCDACFKVNPKLIQCPKCKEVWYCDDQCLQRLRDAHHTRLCPSLEVLLNALQAQVSGDAEACRLARKDVLLLLQLVCTLYSTPEAQDIIPRVVTDPPTQPLDFDNPASVFAHLLPAKDPPRFPVPYPFFPVVSDAPRAGQRHRDKILLYLANRFHNNNFGCWTSDMEPLADGIFPVASRVFNHSCRPNCVIIYEITPKGLVLEVKAVRRIAKDEELTISYVDPAIWLGARRSLLKMNYDFVCDCPKCVAEGEKKLYTSSTWLTEEEMVDAGADLMKLMLPFPPEQKVTPQRPLLAPVPISRGIEELPRNVLPMFNSTNLPKVAQRFSDAAHDGEHSAAVSCGKLVLAIYLVHYTSFWPMVGLHCFELSKAMWNEYVAAPSPTATGRRQQLFEALCCAEWGFHILGVSVARNGDGGSSIGPTEEIHRFRAHVLAEWKSLP